MAMTRKQRTQLGGFIRRKRTARREQERAARRVKSTTSLELEVYEPIGFWFNPRRHGLTVEQCRLATTLLHRRNRENPIRGMSKRAQFRRALRIAGIVSAVKGGRVGNRSWGKRMLATKGGNTMRNHALSHLRAIAPLGGHAAQAAREGKKMLKAWEQRQSAPQGHAAWQENLAAGPWEMGPKDFMAY